MSNRTMRLAVLAGLASFALVSQQSQAWTLARTYLSGLGSDTNPCTRALPCQTLNGALPNTSAFGEIYILDGDEIATGSVTIAQSVTILGAGGRGGVTGTLYIGPPAGGNVVLKDLDIDAQGGVAISVTTSVGVSLVVDHCTVIDSLGIFFSPGPGTATSNLFVFNTDINNQSLPSGDAIVVEPGGTSPSIAVIEGVTIENAYNGILATDYANVTVRNTVVSKMTLGGIKAVASAGGPATILVEHSQSSHNGGNGVIASGGTAVVRLHDVTITDNVTGINAISGGQVISFGDNAVAGNTTNGAPTSTSALQ
jgi:hypothetical protein